MKVKKYLIMGLCAIVLVIIVIFYYFQNRIVYTLEIPQVGEVQDISISKNAGEYNTISDIEDMQNILGVLGNNKTTTKESVNDIPMIVDNIIDINLNYTNKEKFTIYIYENNGKFFIEQPYNGIYRITKDDYKKIDFYASTEK